MDCSSDSDNGFLLSERSATREFKDSQPVVLEATLGFIFHDLRKLTRQYWSGVRPWKGGCGWGDNRYVLTPHRRSIRAASALVFLFLTVEATLVCVSMLGSDLRQDGTLS